jgi:hypothetical protein
MERSTDKRIFLTNKVFSATEEPMQRSLGKISKKCEEDAKIRRKFTASPPPTKIESPLLVGLT